MNANPLSQNRPIYPKLYLQRNDEIDAEKREREKKGRKKGEFRENYRESRIVPLRVRVRRNRNFQNLYLIPHPIPSPPLPIPRIYSPWIHAVTRTRDNNSQLPIRVSLDWRVNRDINHARTGRRFELNDQSRKPLDSIKLELSNARCHDHEPRRRGGGGGGEVSRVDDWYPDSRGTQSVEKKRRGREGVWGERTIVILPFSSIKERTVRRSTAVENGLPFNKDRSPFCFQTEIAKRLNAIIAQILPFLSQEHQQQVATAVDRAKQVTMTELNAIIGVSARQWKINYPLWWTHARAYACACACGWRVDAHVRAHSSFIWSLIGHAKISGERGRGGRETWEFRMRPMKGCLLLGPIMRSVY